LLCPPPALVLAASLADHGPLLLRGQDSPAQPYKLTGQPEGARPDGTLANLLAIRLELTVVTT
jgi:hypothetical protein